MTVDNQTDDTGTQELREQIKDIQGHCMHRDDEKCWYQETVDSLRKEEWDEDVVDRRLSQIQDDALESLINTRIAAVLEDTIDELQEISDMANSYYNSHQGNVEMLTIKKYAQNRIQALRKEVS